MHMSMVKSLRKVGMVVLLLGVVFSISLSCAAELNLPEPVGPIIYLGAMNTRYLNWSAGTVRMTPYLYEYDPRVDNSEYRDYFMVVLALSATANGSNGYYKCNDTGDTTYPTVFATISSLTSDARVEPGMGAFPKGAIDKDNGSYTVDVSVGGSVSITPGGVGGGVSAGVSFPVEVISKKSYWSSDLNSSSATFKATEEDRSLGLWNCGHLLPKYDTYFALTISVPEGTRKFGFRVNYGGTFVKPKYVALGRCVKTPEYSGKGTATSIAVTGYSAQPHFVSATSPTTVSAGDAFQFSVTLENDDTSAKAVAAARGGNLDISLPDACQVLASSYSGGSGVAETVKQPGEEIGCHYGRPQACVAEYPLYEINDSKWLPRERHTYTLTIKPFPDGVSGEKTFRIYVKATFRSPDGSYVADPSPSAWVHTMGFTPRRIAIDQQQYEKVYVFEVNVKQATGCLRVTINPSGAISNGAKWKVLCSDGNWRGPFSGGHTECGLPVGPYIVRFTKVNGWKEPDDIRGTIYKGQTATESGVYTRLKQLDHVTISGQDQVTGISGTTAQYTATAYFTDGSHSDVTGSANWSETFSHASINSSGRLTVTNDLSSDESGSVKCSYTTGGVTKYASKSVTLTKKPKSLDHITISGQDQVTGISGTTAQYTATAYFTDGSHSDVTNSGGWSETFSHASINSSGKFTVTSNLSSDESGYVKCSYTTGGVTKYASKPVTLKKKPVPAGSATLNISPAKISVTPGDTATFDVGISALTNGLKKVNITLTLGSDCCADITGVASGNIPGFTYLTTSSDISADGKTVRLVAYTTGTYSGTGGTLYTITVTGRQTSTASCPITITKNAVIDKDDNDITANTTVNNGSLTCGGPSPFPGENLSPKDHNGNGKYEDCNGDGIANYRDYILLARAVEGLLSGGPAYVASNCQYFDFSGDGQCDYRDYIKLARIIEGLEPGPAAYYPSGVSARVFGQAGESQGQPLKVVLKEALQGLAVYQVVLSVDSGTINGVNVWPLTGIGVTIAPDRKSAIVTGVDFNDRITSGASDVQLAQVWLSDTANVDVTARKLISDVNTEIGTPRFVVTPMTGALSCNHVMASPNPISDSNEVRFVADGQGIASIAVSVYDLGGRLVYKSGFVMGNEVAWDARNESGECLANGVYLYVVTVKGFDGAVIAGEKKTLVLMR